MSPEWIPLHGSLQAGHLGMIPYWLDTDNPAPAQTQLGNAYQGGWHPFEGFKLGKNLTLKYPGDPPLFPLAGCNLRDEIILVYECSWVVIMQLDGSFEACRMD